MKALILTTTIAALLIPGFACGGEYLSKNGRIRLGDVSGWEIRADELQEGAQYLKLSDRPNQIQVELLMVPVGIKIDLLGDLYLSKLRKNLNRFGSEIVAVMEGDLSGQRAAKAFGIQVRERDGRDLIIHVLSINALHGDHLVTMSVMDDDPDIEANAKIAGLIGSLEIVTE